MGNAGKTGKQVSKNISIAKMLENGVLANLRFLVRKLVTIFGMPHYFIKHPQKYY